jgi:hypothetical protein
MTPNSGVLDRPLRLKAAHRLELLMQYCRGRREIRLDKLGTCSAGSLSVSPFTLKNSRTANAGNDNDDHTTKQSHIVSEI